MKDLIPVRSVKSEFIVWDSKPAGLIDEMDALFNSDKHYYRKHKAFWLIKEAKLSKAKFDRKRPPVKGNTQKFRANRVSNNEVFSELKSLIGVNLYKRFVVKEMISVRREIAEAVYVPSNLQFNGRKDSETQLYKFIVSESIIPLLQHHSEGAYELYRTWGDCTKKVKLFRILNYFKEVAAEMQTTDEAQELEEYCEDWADRMIMWSRSEEAQQMVLEEQRRLSNGRQ